MIDNMGFLFSLIKIFDKNSKMRLFPSLFATPVRVPLPCCPGDGQGSYAQATLPC